MGRATFEANMKTLTAVILAAGESKRMRSNRPKALHLLGGRRLIDYPVRVARAIGARVVLVVGRGADEVRAAVGEASDRALVEQHRATGAAATLLTAEVGDPTGYGRVIREGGRPVAIVEHRDATAAQRAIREIATSTYCFDAKRLWPALDRL